MVDRNEKVVGAEIQNNLTHPVPELGHYNYTDLGKINGDDFEAELNTSHGQQITANSTQSFGPLQAGGLYEFTHAVSALTFQPSNSALHYRLGNAKDITVDEEDLRMFCTEYSPYFRIKLQPDQTYVNFFNPTGGGTRGILCRRLV